MRAHLATLLVGTVFVGLAACLRGDPRELAVQVPCLERHVVPVGVVTNELPDEAVQSCSGASVQSVGPPEAKPSQRKQRECGGVTSILLTLFTDVLKVNDSQRSRILSWIVWKDALLLDVPHDENQKRYVEETFEMLVVAELDPAQAEQYRNLFNMNRPPLGGYDIGGVGFTEIDDALRPSIP